MARCDREGVRPPGGCRDVESRGRPLPALRARVARRAVPVQAAHRGADGRLGAEGDQRQLAVSREAAARRARSSRCRRSTRRTSTARASSASPPGAGRPRLDRPTSSALRAAVEAGRVTALYVFDPGPEGSLGDTAWIVEARKRGTLPLLIVQGVLMTDLSRAADFVLPGASYVEKEASYTNEQGRLQGTARAITAAGRRDGRLADSRQPRRRAGRAVRPTPRRRHVRADVAARIGPPLEGLTTLAFNRAVEARALAAGVEPVGALEVGLHVPGSAARQRHCRSIVAAVAAGSNSVERSSVITTPAAVRRAASRLGAFCVLCILSVLCVRERSARAGPAARRGHSRRRAARPRPARKSRLALKV